MYTFDISRIFIIGYKQIEEVGDADFSENYNLWSFLIARLTKEWVVSDADAVEFNGWRYGAIHADANGMERGLV